MTARRISVIVPTCERAAQLRRALTSIRAVEGEDIALEIIVADNASCAETRAIATEFGAAYVAVEKRGVSETRNAAMRMATGEFLAFLDDDDAWLEGHLRPHIRLLDEQPELDMVLGQTVSADARWVADGDPWPADLPPNGPPLLRKMLSGFFPQIGSVVVRRRMLDEIGYFDPALVGGEDLDWLLRIAVRGHVGFVKSRCVLFTHRDVGTFDALQLERLKYDRLVFNRYAWRWWRIWQSPMQFSGAYSGTVMHYYWYFVKAALARAESGERKAALGAIGHAIKIFPLRAAKHLASNTVLRRALLKAMSHSSAVAHLGHIPIWLFATYC